jgi:spermidine synthase
MGMGTSFRSATRHPDIDVTVVELVPAVPRFMHYYHPDADRVMAQPNAHVVVDDGRNYLLMHQRQFDAITIDPPPPLFSAGAVNLYSREFFELCARRLRPGGAICLWVPPAPISDSKMVLRTYATVFPYVSVWSGPNPGFLLMGTLRPVTDVEARVRRGFSDPATVADLTEWDNSCDSPEKVLSLQVCDRNALLEFTSDSPIVTDDTPYTEFPFWRMNGRGAGYWQTLDATDLRQWLLTSKSR